MAAVLKYGCEPPQARSMQSFFKPLPENCHRPNNGRSEPQTLGLDGTADQSEPLPSRLTDVDGQASIDDSTTALTDGPIQPSQNEHSVHTSHDQDEIDIDLNSSRRKRRKLTPKTNQQTLGDQILKLNNKDLKSKTVDTNETPHNGADNADPGWIHDPANESSVSVSTKDSERQTPKKRTPRKRHSTFSANIGSGIVATDQLEIDDGAQGTPSRSKRTSPKNKKKKTMSLHTNGKLISSPPSTSPTSDKTQLKADVKPATARNFKMRNGKFVQTLDVCIRYGRKEEIRKEIGTKIDLIISNSAAQSHLQNNNSKTHPFFLGKSKPKPNISDKGSANEGHQDGDDDSALQRKDPVAWKDIKFTSKKPSAFKSSDSLPPLWPPLPIQHIGYATVSPVGDIATYSPLDRAKRKSRLVQFSEGEDVLQRFATALNNASTVADKIKQPDKRLLRGVEVAASTAGACVVEGTHHAITSVKSQVVSGSTPFDRGECSGPNLWPQHYAPTCWSEVLQPSASVLHDWLQSLAIHNVQSGVDHMGRKQKPKIQGKKKRRKPKGEFDDFIIGSEDEDIDAGKSTKTAILITGPNGCGKTASVFAVAKELGFEVFEIHPGMRRSAKDIFDKVGDMAHNHLVQKGNDLSRGSSVAPSETGPNADTEIDTNQTSVANFFGSKPNLKPSNKDDIAPARAKREQKQSLILFEEVDLLFDDDKGFWSGVQSLIAHSKRPVVLTCNDISSVPVDELDLYDILTYAPVSFDLATDYLMHIAAAEGHILERMALSTLYASKGEDLRASITELNFWCQMTVGSLYGGLDWMGHNQIGRISGDKDDATRIFSQGTFYEALDLLPQVSTDHVAAIKFSQDELGLAALDWCELTDMCQNHALESSTKGITALERLSELTEASSAADMFSGEALYSTVDAIATIHNSSSYASDRHTISQRYIQQHRDCHKPRLSIFAAFEPIMIEKPAFPPSQGRLAPSLDSGSPCIATDVGPYVRAIVNFDQHIEQHRDELFGSQGKQRTTRAARAAAEGGDKSNTRNERWFPKDLSFDKVLQTANNWPQWYEREHMVAMDTDTEADAQKLNQV